MKTFYKTLLIATAFLSLSGCGEKTQVSIMSFNVRFCKDSIQDGENNWIYRREAAVAMINDIKPDLLGLQEAVPVQYEYLNDNLPDYGNYGVGRSDGAGKGESMKIYYRLDRFDLLDKGTFWLSQTPDSVSYGWDAACHRTVTWVKLKDKQDNKELFYFNTHFDHIGKVAREESSKLVVARIKELCPEGTPVYLTADFNINYDDPALDPIYEYMTNGRDSAPETDWYNTFNYWGNVSLEGKNEIIDHVFFKNATPLKYRTILDGYGAKWISDHFPVILTVEK